MVQIDERLVATVKVVNSLLPYSIKIVLGLKVLITVHIILRFPSFLNFACTVIGY